MSGVSASQERPPKFAGGKHKARSAPLRMAHNHGQKRLIAAERKHGPLPGAKPSIRLRPGRDGGVYGDAASRVGLGFGGAAARRIETLVSSASDSSDWTAPSKRCPGALSKRHNRLGTFADVASVLGMKRSQHKRSETSCALVVDGACSVYLSHVKRGADRRQQEDGHHHGWTATFFFRAFLHSD